MTTHIVMDRNGDTRHVFDSADPKSTVRAKKHFDAMMGRGYRAVVLGKDGRAGTLLREFDPATEEILFIPQLQGG